MINVHSYCMADVEYTRIRVSIQFKSINFVAQNYDESSNSNQRKRVDIMTNTSNLQRLLRIVSKDLVENHTTSIKYHHALY